jgi:tetratricopeptide (TPR) repeat protein
MTDDPESHSEEPQSDPQKVDRKLSWRLRIGVLVVLGAGILYYVVPREIARWQMAAAMAAAADGDFELAIFKADKAIHSHPNSATLYAQRANIRRQMEDFQAAEQDLDKALDVSPSVPEFYYHRAIVRQRLSKHEAAVRDLDRYIELVTNEPLDSKKARERYADGLNSRAYVRAIGNLEITEGLSDIEKAFLVLGSEDSAALLDTRGYLLYLDGQYSRAKVDLEKAVGIASAELRQFPESAKGYFTDKQATADRKTLEQNLAVMLHHRGLVYKELQQHQAAEADLKQAKELGYDPAKGIF